MPKRNDKSLCIADWTTKKLKQEAIEYYNSIYVFECYSIGDIRAYSIMCAELLLRGYEIVHKTSTISFNKLK